MMMRVISLKHVSSTVFGLLLDLALISVAHRSYNADWFYEVYYFDDLLALDITSPVSVHTQGQCAVQCLHDADCESFFYHEDDGHCWIRTKMACESDPMEYRAGVRYFVKLSKVLELCPEGPHALVVVHTCTCFSFQVTDPLPWSLARDACLQANRTLAVLNTDDRAGYLLLIFESGDTGLPTDKGYYVDATRENNTQLFMWPSGEVVWDLLWSAGEPDESNAANTVVAFNVMSLSSFGAMAVDEVTPRYYICQRPYYFPYT